MLLARALGQIMLYVDGMQVLINIVEENGVRRPLKKPQEQTKKIKTSQLDSVC